MEIWKDGMIFGCAVDGSPCRMIRTEPQQAREPKKKGMNREDNKGWQRDEVGIKSMRRNGMDNNKSQVTGVSQSQPSSSRDSKL